MPWVAIMDDEDLAEFVAELEHAIATAGTTPDRSPHRGRAGVRYVADDREGQ